MNWGLRDFYAGEADDDARYVVILVKGARLPHAVVRVNGTIEEAFTHNLRWEPSNLLSRVPDEPSWTARDAEVGYANGFLVEMVRVLRAAEHESVSEENLYYGVFKNTVDVLDLDKAYMLVRRSQQSGEQDYDGNRLWVWTDKLYRLDSGRDWTEEYVAITAAEAERLRQRFDRRMGEWCRFHAVTEQGRLRAVVRVFDRISRTEAFTGDHEWRSTDLVGGEEVDRERAVELMAALVQQHRQGAGFTAGYAVFDQPTDVLDLSSVREVVERPVPGVTLPITKAERDSLEMTIHVRQAKARAVENAEYSYVALFPTRADLTDLGAALSVIRRRGGETGHWEMFLRDGEWPPTRKPDQALSLPIRESDVKRLTRGIARKKTRYFELRYELGPLAKIRLTRGTEEAADGFAWKPSAFLGRWRDEPTWIVREVTENTMTVMMEISAQIAEGVAKMRREQT